MDNENRDFGYEQEFEVFASEQEAHFKKVTGNLSAFAIDQTVSNEDRIFLEEAGKTLLFDARELVDALTKIDRPIDRGDAFYFVSELIAAAFTVGGRTGLSHSSAKLAHKLRQSEAAKSGAQKRASEAKQWQAWVREQQDEIRKHRPSITTSDLTDLIRSRWPSTLGATRGHESIAQFIRTADRENKISRLK